MKAGVHRIGLVGCEGPVHVSVVQTGTHDGSTEPILEPYVRADEDGIFCRWADGRTRYFPWANVIEHAFTPAGSSE